MNSNPLRRKSPEAYNRRESQRLFHDREEAHESSRSPPPPNEPISEIKVTEHRRAAHDEGRYERDSVQLHNEIAMLNSRLDAIDSHCRHFSKLANDKAQMEDNLRSLAQLTQIQCEQDRLQAEKARL